jgi:hypothetical protein
MAVNMDKVQMDMGGESRGTFGGNTFNAGGVNYGSDFDIGTVLKYGVFAGAVYLIFKHATKKSKKKK